MISGLARSTNDLLNCGICKKAFPLEDISKFVQHKSEKCYRVISSQRDNACKLKPLGSPTISASDQIEKDNHLVNKSVSSNNGSRYDEEKGKFY